MSSYRQEMYSEMFAWIYQYPELGKIALLFGLLACLAVAAYELVDYLRVVGGNRAD